MTDREAVLKVLRDQEAANARSDADAVVAPLAGGAILFDLPPPLESGCEKEIIAAGLSQWFNTWESGVTVRMKDPTIMVDGDLAVVFGLSRMQGVKKGSGPLDAWNRRTVVLQRTGGEWEIVHEHSSYPMAMDGSGRSMTDLEPDGATPES